MRIVTLDPSLTEIVTHLDLSAGELVGVSHDSDLPDDAGLIARVSRQSHEPLWPFSADPDVALLRAANPELILARSRVEVSEPVRKKAREEISALLGREVDVRLYAPLTLGEIYETYESIGALLNRRSGGHRLADRLKAQTMDWAANFYERMRHKRVTFLSSLEPLELAGLWIPDLIHTASGVSQHRIAGEPNSKTTWAEIHEFRPDVLIVAPQGMDLDSSARSFKALEKLPQWEDILAVKRGQVFFCDGARHFYRFGPELLDSTAILVSAMAGLESGYITKRDSFYRLRFLEMQRHRF